MAHWALGVGVAGAARATPGNATLTNYLLSRNHQPMLQGAPETAPTPPFSMENPGHPP